MISELCSAVNESDIEIISPNIKKELRTYQREDMNQIKIAKDQTKHWDLIMAIAIAYQLRRNVAAKKSSYTDVKTFDPYKSF